MSARQCGWTWRKVAGASLLDRRQQRAPADARVQNNQVLSVQSLAMGGDRGQQALCLALWIGRRETQEDQPRHRHALPRNELAEVRLAVGDFLVGHIVGGIGLRGADVFQGEMRIAGDDLLGRQPPPSSCGMCSTVMRVPRMTGFPSITLGSRTMRSCCFMMGRDRSAQSPDDRSSVWHRSSRIASRCRTIAPWHNCSSAARQV